MPRFNANIRWMFKEYDMPERLARAAQCGFKGVEHGDPYAWPAADMARWLADNGLAMVQILTPLDWAAGETGLACLPSRVADFRDGVQRALAYGAAIGKPLIHPAIGSPPAGEDRARCHAVLVENLAYACDQARADGVGIIIEPVCRARFADFFLHTLEEGVALMRDVGRDNLKLCFDTYHVQMEEGAVCTNAEAYWPHIGHMQIGNPPGRHEPGNGELHLPYFFDLLDRKEWAGWVGCEYTPSAHTLDTLAWGAPYGIGKP